MLYRGTTPTIGVEVPDIDATDVADVWFTIECGDVEITKTKHDLTMSGNVFAVTLSQEETLSFKDNNINIQLRIKLNDGKAVATNIIRTTKGDILKDGVI